RTARAAPGSARSRPRRDRRGARTDQAACARCFPRSLRSQLHLVTARMNPCFRLTTFRAIGHGTRAMSYGFLSAPRMIHGMAGTSRLDDAAGSAPFADARSHARLRLAPLTARTWITGL